MRRLIFTAWWNVGPNPIIDEYIDRLVANKEKYASAIGVDFLYINSKDELSFTEANIRKHQLFAEFAEEYDEVMYIDMDVVFNTNLNVFEELNLSKGVHIKDEDHKITDKNIQTVFLSHVGKRSAILKYHITRDLLDSDCHVLNTGVMIGKSEHIKKIQYVERLDKIKSKINELKEDIVYLRRFYYANNEAIFSYILEKYNIPYVIMDDTWHYIIDEDPKEHNLQKANIIHFINKKFNTFFNDKTKCIYSLYIEIPDEKLDNPAGPSDDPVNKSKRTKERLAKYKDDLITNHNNYAKSCGAVYKTFNRDEEYEQFFSQYPDLSEYDVINLYKVYLLDKLTKEYDLVLYIDLDVYFTNNTIDVFNYLPAETKFCCDTATASQSGVQLKNPRYFENYNVDFRNPQSKYWNAHALLQEEDIDGDHLIFNTGIMMASKNVMDQIDYFSDIHDVIATMKELKEFSMYPPKIQAQFGYDNETIMGYKTKKNNVPLYSLSKAWHFKHDYNKLESYDKENLFYKKAKYELEAKIKEHSVQLVHFISKNFGLIFDEN